jgi:hypothetical protein
LGADYQQIQEEKQKIYWRCMVIDAKTPHLFNN